VCVWGGGGIVTFSHRICIDLTGAVTAAECVRTMDPSAAHAVAIPKM